MKNHRSLFILAGALAAMLAVAPVSAQDAGTRPSDRIHKLDKRLRESLSKAPRPERVIIRTKDGQRAALRLALEAHGDVVTEDHPEVGALSAVVHGEDLLALANDPAVESVSVDANVRADGAGARARGKAPAPKTQKAARPMGTGDLRRLQALTGEDPSGKGVGVAIIDSGIEPDSNDLLLDVTAFVDFTQGVDPVFTRAYDDYGHGTFIASMIANNGKGGIKYQGMAPHVHLIGLKVLDSNGNGRTSDVIQAIEFAVANKDALDIDIINLSLGHPIFESAATDPLVIAVERAHAAGIVVVASAGNFGMNPNTNEAGYGGIASPGNAPSAITVGAVDQRDTLGRGDDYVAPFSSRGPTWIDGFAKPDIVGPGVGEVSRGSKYGSLFTLFPDLRYEDASRARLLDLAKLSGTSMAAAAVSGIAAVVLEANPDLTPSALKAVLEYTATPLGGADGQPLDALTQGAGEVNGAGAVALARAIDADPDYADGWVVGDVTLATRFSGHNEAWSQNIVWGNYFVSALPAAMFANGAPYRDNIVWGTLGRDNIVWGSFARDGGDNIVWGNLAVWGSRYDTAQRDNIVWGSFARGGDNIVWGTFDRGGDNIVWGSFFRGGDNIVWGSVTRDGDNIVWGNNIVWSQNIVWGDAFLGFRADDGDNIVWGNLLRLDGDFDNIVWGNLYDDNIVWGNILRWDGGDGDNIVWGNSVIPVGF